MQPAASWMQKTLATDADLFSWELRNVGCPRCNVAGAPQGCIPLTQWRDDAKCVVDTFGANVVVEDDGTGTNVDTLVRVDCDMSDGHSGGPVYRMNPQGFAQVIGVAIFELCVGSNCQADPDGDYPNLVRRLTQPMLNQLNFWAGFFGP